MENTKPFPSLSERLKERMDAQSASAEAAISRNMELKHLMSQLPDTVRMLDLIEEVRTEIVEGITARRNF